MNGITSPEDYCTECGHSIAYIQKWQLDKFCEYNAQGHKFQSEVDVLRKEVKLKEVGNV